MAKGGALKKHEILKLHRQSNISYNLYRIATPRGYFVERIKDKKKTRVLTVDEAENLILYGVTNSEVKHLDFN
jgi:hypothetical protein